LDIFDDILKESSRHKAIVDTDENPASFHDLSKLEVSDNIGSIGGDVASTVNSEEDWEAGNRGFGRWGINVELDLDGIYGFVGVGGDVGSGSEGGEAK